ncbi:hypothetical protein IWW57_000444 [Coemansia sp. S610]|uniref:Uncharacterized protein n=1 Tax=Coemansia spiralis TaxID=417178 RepID=A0A9W8GJX5_9FUNG|nr:hypothetical protein LPJ60_004688 [Coemansia sp. RSA 2675]KAJ2025603.1 hypothetical protein GGI06_000519 [Coemansia sp. S85]KAJ2031988.1 hypothetical protein IWW57_000444 [Coemansia sp. S610]KAJ2385878.1 hypothetical protein H4S02_004117 [Coemansia sp. RSA 2611]KAJ2415446.1 hypothetical protein GGI10_001691 [Coemansia sp. RSA 2530]KAJ2690245.1 hypothetical protein IWW39_000926 [Coemansia spiralis]KAJ2698831.1 hypothetical protein H4218_003026 [Coemansia sp. IMI 209128]
MSTHNAESCVINAPLEKVWAAISAQDFKFWSLVKSTNQLASPSEVGGTREVTFNDGTVQTYRLIEYSLVRNALTYEIIDSKPSVDFLSAQHTIQVTRVTANNTSFVQWISDYSADGSEAVVMDSKYKKLDALAELAKSLEN